MKKIQHFFLTTLVLLCSALTSWAQQYSFGDLQYEPTSVVYNYVSVIKCFRTTGALTIPSTVVLYGRTYTVTSIGSSAFENCSGLTEVTIPESVTSIGSSAFSGCSGLTEITIPNSVTSIYGNAFSGCSGLTEVTIPESVTSIGSSAFSGCSGLTKITLPFTGNKQHTASETNQYPLGYIFGTSEYTGGTETTQEYYGSSTSSTTSTKYYIPTSLKEVVITGSSYIPYGAFYGCSNLTSVTIPESVTSIGSSAFYGCSGLTKITLPFTGDKPHTATDQYQYPFGFIFGESSYTSATATTQLYYYGSSTSSWTRTTYYIPTSLKEVVITGCSHIPYGAFYNCSGLTEVTIGNSVTSIGERAFKGCSGLTEVTIGNSVTTIGEEAFSGCSGLTEVTIPESVTSIGVGAFENCSGLTEITIPNSVTSIGSSAFSGCSGLTEVTIPNSVTLIGNYAFDGCSGLTEVTIPNTVTSIGYSAFKGCSGLTEVTIPESVTLIDNYAFSGCSGLTEVTIPNSVTSIGQYAFNGCSSLTEVTIPNSVTSIGNSAFWGCIGLTKITLPFTGDKRHTASETNQYPLGYIFGTSEYTGGTETTQKYHGSSSIYTTSTKYYIPTLLKDVVITGSSYIPYGAFYGCSKLTSITIPSSVTSVGDEAFSGCSKAKEIVFEGETVPTFGTSVFYSSNNCPIYVPTAAAVTAYKGATNMNNYASRVKVNPVRTITVEANNADYGTVTGGGKFDTRTTTSTEISAAANEHYQFVSWSDGKTNNPRTITISGAATYTAIFKRVLTVSDIVVANKEYDGTTEATVSSYQTDKLESDDVTVNVTASFNTANAGTNKEVSYNIELGGTDADKYVLASTAGTTTADITAKSVSNPTITLSATSFTYNGSAQTPTVTVKDGQTVIPTSEYTVTMTTDVTNVGEKTVTITDNEGGNYVVSGSAHFTINPKEVSNPTIELSATEFNYSGEAYEPTVTVKDGQTVIPTSEYTVGYSNNTNAGTATVNITDKDNGNYTVTGSANFTINPKEISNPTIELSATTFTYSGEANEPTVTVKDGSTTIPTSEYTVGYSNNTNAGTATVNITDKANGNYTVRGSAQFTINPKEVLNPTIALSVTSFTYNGSAQKPSVTSVKDGETVIPTSEYTVGYSNNTNAGTATVTITDKANGNYTVNGSANFTINPKAITASATADNREYDGTTVANGSITLNGKVGTDNVSASYTSAAFADKNVGNSKTVTFSGIAISGTDKGNYTLSNTEATATANITARSLTLSNFKADSKTYDATTNATGGQFSDNRVSGDVLEFSYNYSFANKNVGNGKDVNFSSIAISGGADKNNYTLAATTGAAKADITVKTLAISNIKAENKTYDGNTTTSVSYTTDKVATDDVTFGTTATFADKNVGNGKAVSFNYTKSGADAANYAFANATGSTTANITPRELAISSVSAASKEYDGNTATTVTIAASNIVSGDVVTFGTAAAFADKNVGTNKTVNFTYTKSGADAANYKFANAEGTAKANITARELVLSNFAASDKTYDGTTNATGGSFSDDRVSGDALEFSFNYAFANMNAANAVAVNFSNITISGGADKDNYTLLTTTGTCSAKISPVTDEVVLNFTMPTRTVMYNGQANRYEMPTADELFSTNNELYRMYGGFQPADNDAFQAARANVLAQTEVGEYTFGYNSGTLVNTSANFTNVKFNVTDGKLIITPNTNVVVTITENSSELTYNTEEQRVEGYTYSINDELNIYSEEDFSFSGNAVAAGTTVGTYPMELSAADFSNTNTNFADVTFNIVDGALTITKAPVAPNKPEAAIETRYINTQLVALPADWAWSEYAALAMGNNTATANYTGADKGNYQVESVDVTITRLECLHNEGNEVLYTLEPTCTHKGYTGNLSCKLCGVIYEMGDSIPALGHDFVETVIVPTCTAVGYTEHLCNRCQHIEYSDTVAANGHKADSVVFENMVAATCTVAGSYDSVVYCSVCRVELSRDVVDVPAAGHKADSVVIENIVRPTLEAAGSYDSVIYCSVCKTEISRKKIDILASAVAVSKLPNKVEYKQGEKLDVAGGKLTATYTDKSTEDFEMLSGWVSGFDSEKVGKQTLTVKFETVSSTLTTTFDVTVSAKDDDTAISEEAENEVSIYAYQNVIVVEAADAITGEIAVFDVNGRMVAKTLAAGTRTEIQMQKQGLYIVRVGGTAKRVVIK